MKKLCFLLLFFFSTALSLYAAESENILLTEDIQRIEEKLKIINNNITYLKNEQVDYIEFTEKLDEAEKLYYDLKFSDQIKDVVITRKLLTSNLTELISLTQRRVAFVKRMELMYRLMVVMGMSIIIILLVYSIYMYSRRK